MVNTPEAEDNQNKYVRGEETDGVMTTEEKIQKQAATMMLKKYLKITQRSRRE